VFKSIKKILDSLLESLVIVVVAVLVVDVVLQILVRVAPWILEVIPLPEKLRLILRTGTEEMAVFMLIWVSLLGAAVALNRGAHLGIDYFVSKLSPRKRLYTEIIVFLCVAIFSLTVMVIGGIDLVSSTFRLGQLSPALRVRVGYVYLAVPISGFFLVLYSVIGLAERLTSLFKGTPGAQQEAKEMESGII
jgi:TRAP-type C4-dicarboxylate transport system permease small subunit